MFTGIIEQIGSITNIITEGSNIHFTLKCGITSELKIDQSVAHNGVCLTVVKIDGDKYTVTAIEETLKITSLSNWAIGDEINIERAMVSGGRLDGHQVQGHVDQTAICKKIEEVGGSTYFHFEFAEQQKHLLVNKGSICIDGVSLTVVNANNNLFSVAIIPYTIKHTCFNNYKIGTIVNIEFDIMGKYIERYMELYKSKLN